MKAMVFREYGSTDVLHLEDLPMPTPRDNEVLVKVHATSINAGDWHLMRADPFLVRLMFGLFKPRINVLGSDVAGQIEAVGSKVTQFQQGDAVFADVSVCGFGGFAEYVCVPEHLLAKKPAKLSFDEAATVPAAAATALQALRDKGKMQAGQKVLINGASGGVGTFAVQIAKSFDAEVTGVCSTRNLEMVRSLGADHVIDYTQEDFTQSSLKYDLILAANGYQSILQYRRALTPTGRYVMTGGKMSQMYQAMFLGPWMSMVGRKKLGNMLVKPNQADLNFLTDLIDAGKITPIIDKRYTLSEVPEAIRYMEEEHARGKIAIAVVDDSA